MLAMQPVEHVRIGRYVFPRYSHPLMRNAVSDEAYVQEEIDRQLQNPKLQTAVNEVVEKLLQQGVTGEPSEEETEMYLEEALAHLGTFFMDGGSNPTDFPAAESTPPPLHLPQTPTRHFFPTPCRKPRVASRGRGPAIVSPKTLVSRQQQQQQQQRQRNAVSTSHSQEEEPKKNGKHGATLSLPAPITLAQRHLMPCFDNNSSSSSSNKKVHSNQSDDVGGEKEKWGRGDVCCTSQLALPLMAQQRRSIRRQPIQSAAQEWQNAVRVLIYSMLSLRLEECGGLGPEEMDLRSGAQHLVKLQGARLTSLSGNAFGALDITLDGNSSIIHCRKGDTPSLIQLSHNLVAEKMADVKPNALRQRVMRTLARLKATSCMGKPPFRRMGTTLSRYPWGMPLSQGAIAPAECDGELQLPSATYRGRVLTSILKCREPQEGILKGGIMYK